MATEKQRMYRKNLDGTKDLIYRETSSDVVMHKGTNLENKIDGIDSSLAETTQDIINCRSVDDLTSSIEKSKNENKILYLGKNNYTLNSNFEISGLKDIVIDGEITIPDGCTLTIRGDKTTASHFLKLNTISGNGVLRILGFKNANITVQNCKNLEICTDAISDSTAYCTLYLGRIDNLKLNAHSKGWINDNLFIGGRIITRFDIVGEYNCNNNVFDKLILETSATTLNIERGSLNTFRNIRLEDNPTIIFGANTYGNRIYNSFRSNYASSFTTLPIYTYTDNGDNNEIINSILDSFDVETIIDVNTYSSNLGTLITRSGDNLTNATFKTLIETEELLIPKENFGIDFLSDKTDWHIQIQFYNENKVLLEDETLLYSPNVTWSPTYKRFQTGVKQRSVRIRINNKNKTAKYMKFILIGYELPYTFFNLKLICNKHTYLGYLKNGFKLK